MREQVSVFDTLTRTSTEMWQHAVCLYAAQPLSSSLISQPLNQAGRRTASPTNAIFPLTYDVNPGFTTLIFQQLQVSMQPRRPRTSLPQSAYSRKSSSLGMLDTVGSAGAPRSHVSGDACAFGPKATTLTCHDGGNQLGLPIRMHNDILERGTYHFTRIHPCYDNMLMMHLLHGQE